VGVPGQGVGTNGQLLVFKLIILEKELSPHEFTALTL